MREWYEIREDVKEMANMSCRPTQKRVKPDYIFDEEKSVKWNREQVEKHNASVDEEVKRLNTEKNKMRDTLYQEIYDHIISDLEGKTSKSGAIALFDYAYQEGEEYGVFSVFLKLKELIKLAQKVLGI